MLCFLEKFEIKIIKQVISAYFEFIPKLVKAAWFPYRSYKKMFITMFEDTINNCFMFNT